VSLAGPVLALTSGGTASVPAPKVPTPPCTVLLQNVSPYALQAQIQGGTVWIPPYTQQSVPWSNSVGVTVSAEPVITSPSGAPASLLVTFYNQGEVVPPNGPITGYTSITGAVVNATISGPVTVSGTVAISSGTVNVGTVAGSISIAAGQVIQVENVPSGSVTVAGTVAISSGTVNVGTISGAISIAASQVVQVENVPAGSVTVAGTVAISSGTVNVGTISGAISIAAGQVVQVENVPAGTIVVGGTVAISSGTVNVGTVSGSVTIASGSVTVSGTVAISSGTINVGTISGAVSLTSGQTIITETGSVTDINPCSAYGNNAYTPAAGATWYQILAANAARRGLFLFADWTNAAQMAVGFVGSGYPIFLLNPGDYWEMPAPVLQAAVYGWWSVVPTGGNFGPGIRITEVT